ncbi:uncharacterized protein LOC131938850 [Physella acuta]|uniref:uncharacterized protein LOC131938850 n=1 Tax=Physella acuta TaxID=109671 RepID=UPI0027DDCC31|nr:uncharacterized protein LOC131938850 [Physella acuta]
MGDYFVAYLPRLPAGSTAQAHVISPFIECTKVTQTVTYVSPANVTTQRVIQTWAAIFDIPVDVIPTQTGISGAFVYRGNGKFSLDVYIDVKGQQVTAYIPVVPVEGFGRRYLVHTFKQEKRPCHKVRGKSPEYRRMRLLQFYR